MIIGVIVALFSLSAAAAYASDGPRDSKVATGKHIGAIVGAPDGRLVADSAGPVSGPSASWTTNGGRLDVFEVFHGRLLQKYWTAASGWQGWFDFGAPAAQLSGELRPAVTWTSGGGRLDVFVTGRDNGHLYQRFWTNASGWSDWIDLGGILVSAPGASWTTNGGRLDVFGVGEDGRLYQLYWTAATGTQGWFGFDPPPVGAGSAPAVTWTSGGGRLDVFIRGASDGHLYQKFWTNASGWSDWIDLGGILVTTPGASWTTNGGRLDIFGIGTDGRLHQLYWTAASGWQGWFGFDPPPVGAGSAPAVTWTSGGGRLDVFVTGRDGNIYQKFWTNASGWSDWVNLG